MYTISSKQNPLLYLMLISQSPAKLLIQLHLPYVSSIVLYMKYYVQKHLEIQ